MLGATEDGGVKLIHTGKNKFLVDWPFWTKGQKDDDGYFTLSYHKRLSTSIDPVLTANFSMDRLTIKGKTLRLIPS